MVNGNYKNIKTIIQSDCKIAQVDGILFDFGISSIQLDNPSRGFSYLYSGPLDMRLDPLDPKSMTAGQLINNLSEDKLSSIINQWGEEPLHREIAQAIVHFRLRQKTGLQTTQDLSDVIKQVVEQSSSQNKSKMEWKGTAARTFQAFRIAVNNELNCITSAIMQCSDLVRVGGRLCVLSFQPLEDIRVNDILVKTPEQAALWKQLTPEAVKCTAEEYRSNSRARSGRFRVFERI